eukprot:CAMPEP_0173429912 /NCGR_PEP_ID=MMETSP1357-20121228/8487_1 /TAXON_ID=77926 /ORGANISM="Hemiselmis rufescens, Strain PCC563" /LENGTH=130 /DNA_ID=CAMNT_0014394161 /DNA_START=105 /DNA_END=494 /DNA_ORIENTATION=+
MGFTPPSTWDPGFEPVVFILMFLLDIIAERGHVFSKNVYKLVLNQCLNDRRIASCMMDEELVDTDLLENVVADLCIDNKLMINIKCTSYDDSTGDNNNGNKNSNKTWHNNSTGENNDGNKKSNKTWHNNS